MTCRPTRSRLAGAALAALAVLVAACTQDPTVEVESARRVTIGDPSTTTTDAAPTTTLEALPPHTTAAPPVDEEAEARAAAATAALRFLTESERAEVERACRETQPVTVVDHPEARWRVAVVGDSLTVQTVGLLTGDARFDWVIAASCGSRSDHFAGRELLDGRHDLRPDLEAVLTARPDVLVVALGTNDVLEQSYTNVPREVLPGIEALLTAAREVPCVAWVDVHASSVPAPAGTTAWRWGHYAPHYNDTLRAFENHGWMRLAGWDARVAARSIGELFFSDGIHLNSEGARARADLMVETATELATGCATDPDPPLG